MSSSHLVDAFLAAGRRGSFFVSAHNPIETSDHARLQPIVAPAGIARHATHGLLCSGAMCDQHHYSASLHPPKARVAFGSTFYEYLGAIAVFGDATDEAALLLEAHQRNLAKRHGVHVACVTPDRNGALVRRPPATCASLLAAALLRVRTQDQGDLPDLDAQANGSPE